MKSVENFKRSVRRFVTRTALLGVLVALGAMSIAQSQRGNTTRTEPQVAEKSLEQPLSAIPDHGPTFALASNLEVPSRASSGPSMTIAPSHGSVREIGYEEPDSADSQYGWDEDYGVTEDPSTSEPPGDHSDARQSLLPDAPSFAARSSAVTPPSTRGTDEIASGPPSFDSVQMVQNTEPAERTARIPGQDRTAKGNPLRTAPQMAPHGAVPGLLPVPGGGGTAAAEHPNTSDYDQPNYGERGYAEPDYTQPNYHQPDSNEPAPNQPDSTDPITAEPGYAGAPLPPWQQPTDDPDPAGAEFSAPEEPAAQRPEPYGTPYAGATTSPVADQAGIGRNANSANSAAYDPPPFQAPPPQIPATARSAPFASAEAAVAPAGGPSRPATSPNQYVSPSESASSGRYASGAVAGGTPRPLAADSPGSGTGSPGSKDWEGPQSPSLMLQKELPQEVQVGQSARMVLRIRNVGQVTAQHVRVRDEVPRGTRLIKTHPEAQRADDGGLVWELGSLSVGQEAMVEMHIEPIVEGRIGSVASVTFEAAATASTLVTRPNLTLDHTGPQQVMIGDLVRFAIQISNSGTGTAEHVILQEDVPAGLAHSAGRKLEYEVGAIGPGETRHLELTLKAAQAGQVENIIMARAAGEIEVQDVAQVEIIAPELNIRLEGPNRRYLNRTAVYTVALENPGTAAANNVDLMVQLPEGLKFVNTNNSGHYESGRHAIRWNLAALPSKKRGWVEFTVTPQQMGEHTIHASAQALLGLSDSLDHVVTVDGVPALHFAVTDTSDPVEVGGETAYEIRVVNQGSKAATNVRIVAELPEGIEALRADGATNGRIQPQHVEFDPVAQLLPQQELKYRIDVRGTRNGDWRFTVNMTSDDTTTPVTKQESTHVYSDQ